jgi:putative nucleotidyltransferase with HDIG domain
MKERILAFLKRLPSVTRYLLIGVVILMVSLLFPNTTTFNFKFEKNGIWRYEDMTAPFDFAIQKPEEVYQAEVNTLKSKLNPFYLKDSQITATQRNLFEAQFLSKIQSADLSQYQDVRENQNLYRQLGNRLLFRIFGSGVIKISEQQAIEGENTIINVLYARNRAERRIIKNIRDEDQAEKLMSDSLYASNLPQADFLLDLMEKAIMPNIAYNDSITQYYHQLEINKIARSKDKIQKGDVIVRRGNTVDENTYQKLLSLKDLSNNQTDEKNSWLVFSGYLLLTFFLIGALVLYFAIYEKSIFSNFQKLAFMLMWIAVFSYISYSIYKIGFINPYLIPFCIAPIVIKNFYNERVAFFTHIIIVLLAGFLSAQGYEFLFVQILVGIVVVLSNVKTRNWSGFFISMLFIFLTYVSIYLALSFIKEGLFSTIDLQPIGWIALNTLLTLLAYPLVPLLERIFGFTSDITLVELGSLDNPLLKELSLKAPGTLQHSLQVGNLAESAVSAIGGNALLVKVAALYHDVGKMKNPFHFIENQSGQSPHDNLTPLQSATFILEHSTEGERIAKKEGLPKVIIDFIVTHHGTTRVEYFYRKHLKENPDTEVDPSLFTYKGRRPKTKEEAVLMMADSIEAASKSLKNPNEEAIDSLVEGIIAGKMKQNQFDEADLTFKEMEIVKGVFKKLLKSIYHVRIAYPDGK